MSTGNTNIKRLPTSPQDKRQRLLEQLARTLRLMDTQLSIEQIEHWMTVLMQYDETAVNKAFYRVTVEIRGRIYLSDLYERIPKSNTRVVC